MKRTQHSVNNHTCLTTPCNALYILKHCDPVSILHYVSYKKNILRSHCQVNWFSVKINPVIETGNKKLEVAEYDLLHNKIIKQSMVSSPIHHYLHKIGFRST